jgi:hypothetical protein
MSILAQHADKWRLKPNTGCWIWHGALGGSGSGASKRYDRPVVGKPGGGGSIYITRIICEEAHGPPPSPKHNALHNTADGRVGAPCVNPDHLRWGTQKENMADMTPEARSERIRLGATRMSKEARMERHRKMLAKRWPGFE